ncbi:hypothetical protein SAMN05216339_102366 [Nitrosomonas eutropha]|uniref:Uncharacterized protein n=1 Tax=Nitrosomonas eutropha TaxID=916 RepID=A0A1I7GC97_9PROT|nr:hypothetical protein SAMN05216339_102366 [Nitrosomonas eutropha]
MIQGVIDHGDESNSISIWAVDAGISQGLWCGSAVRASAGSCPLVGWVLTNGHVLRSSIGVMDQGFGGAAIIQSLFQRIEHEIRTHGAANERHNADTPRGQSAIPSCRLARPRKHPGAGRYTCSQLQFAVELRLGEKSTGCFQYLIGTTQFFVLSSNTLRRSRSLAVRPSRVPSLTSLRLTHSSSVEGTQPIFGAIDSTAAHSDGYLPRCS